MNRISNNALRKAFAEQRTGAAMRGPEAFWGDFRARARLRAQDEPETRRLWLPAWPAYAKACAVLALFAVTVWVVYPAGAAQPAAVTSMEVIAPHSAVLIINDAQTDSTVLWITGMNTDTRNGDRP
jgi:hypothetical protein